MSIVERFCDSIFNETKQYAAYPPNGRIRLGDFGRVRGRRFDILGNVQNLARPIPALGEIDPGEFTREIKIGRLRRQIFRAGATVDAVVQVKAGLKIEFESSFAAFVNVTGCRHRRVSEINRLGGELLRRSKLSGTDPDWWDTSYAVVTSVMTARNSTTIISREAKRSMTLEAIGDVPTINLADVDLSLSVQLDDTASEKWITEKATEAEPLTPFFGVHQIHPWVFASWTFQPLEGFDETAPAPIVFESESTLTISDWQRTDVRG